MRVIQFSGKKMVDKGSLSWEEIEEGVDWGGSDIRFKLYEGRPARPKEIHTLFFDIDGLPGQYDDQVMDTVIALFPFKAYIMFTGGGYHVYIPLETGYVNDEIPMAQEGYHEQCDALEEQLKEAITGETFHVDHQVFNGARYGRVPGSTNSKHGEKVRLAGIVDGDILPDLSDLLVYREVEKIEKVHVPVIGETSDKWEDSILYNNCAMSRWITENVNEGHGGEERKRLRQSGSARTQGL